MGLPDNLIDRILVGRKFLSTGSWVPAHRRRNGMTALPFQIDEIRSLVWEIEPRPILQPPRFSPIIADPTVLAPEAADGQWHLIAHSIFGLHHYTSADGLAWQGGRLFLRHAMRAHLTRSGDVYVLHYERYRPFQIMASWLPVPWKSRIERRESTDLAHWTRPAVMVRPALSWEFSSYGASVSNPCFLPATESDPARLYYSGGLALVPDCGFCEPVYIGLVKVGGGLETRRFDPPLVRPRIDDPWANLGAGAMKVWRLKRGFLGLQNGIYLQDGKSGSAILMLYSPDGVWERVHAAPILRPGGADWMRSHIYALDLCYRPDDREFRLYFNARNDWHWTRGREVLGLARARL